MTSRLKGVIAAIVTPLEADGSPSFARFHTIAKHLLANGCDGLNVLGTTGEATSFSFEQRAELMRRIGGSGLPMNRLMVGTGAASTAEAGALTRLAGDLGFAGALILPPFYYKGVSDAGILRYFEAIVAKSRATGIPHYLYNFPAMSGVTYTPALIGELIEAFGPLIAGLKDSSGNMPYAREVAALSSTFDVFPSNEASLTEARSGIFAGCISATANINSAYCARAFHEKDDNAQAIATAIRSIFDGRPLVPAVKALVADMMKLPDVAAPLPPFVALKQSELETLRVAYERALRVTGS